MSRYGRGAFRFAQARNAHCSTWAQNFNRNYAFAGAAFRNFGSSIVQGEQMPMAGYAEQARILNCKAGGAGASPLSGLLSQDLDAEGALATAGDGTAVLLESIEETQMVLRVWEKSDGSFLGARIKIQNCN